MSTDAPVHEWRSADDGQPVRITGGCQCGAIRYALHRRPARPCVCHCRMCQKASGNLFGTFAGVAGEHFELTRGQFAAFQTSFEAERCFCAACGTPLAYRMLDGSWVSVTIGSLDQPEAMQPNHFYGEEGRIAWTAEAAAHPATITCIDAAPDHVDHLRRTNRQHPDHDTDTWPPREQSHG
jgi:hypothetical protein